MTHLFHLDGCVSGCDRTCRLRKRGRDGEREECGWIKGHMDMVKDGLLDDLCPGAPELKNETISQVRGRSFFKLRERSRQC